MVGGGGTIKRGLSAADFFSIKLKAVESLSVLHGFFYFLHSARP